MKFQIIGVKSEWYYIEVERPNWEDAWAYAREMTYNESPDIEGFLVYWNESDNDVDFNITQVTNIDKESEPYQLIPGGEILE